MRIGTTPPDSLSTPASPAHAKPGAAGYSTLADVAAAAGATSPANLPKPRRLGGMFMVLVVIVAAAVVLMGMRKLGLSRRLQMVDFKIDYPVEKAELARLSQDHQQVLTDLRSSGEVVQVPLEQVQTNPFEWKLIEKKIAAVADNSAASADEARKRAEARKRELNTRAAALKLNSVLGGRVPVAQVSGHLVRLGDTVDDLFKVTAIEGRSVILSADDMTFTLTLGEPR